MNLKGKVALVTGSTSGIGQGIAEALAADGASIMLNGFGDPAKIEALRASFEQRFGVKALYNGADISKGDQITAINLSGVFHGMKAAIPGMKAKGWGRIINIASAHGLVGSPFKVAYVAAKHGVLGMTKVAAIELANSGVTVNAICPGWVLTPLVQKQLEDRAKEQGTSVEKEIHA